MIFVDKFMFRNSLLVQTVHWTLQLDSIVRCSGSAYIYLICWFLLVIELQIWAHPNEYVLIYRRCEREFRCAAPAVAAARSAGAAHCPLTAFTPALPCEKIIMQSPGRPVWNARQPLTTRNQSTFKCVETHTPSIMMDLLCRETDFSWSDRSN